jgi:hypothetical protein
VFRRPELGTYGAKHIQSPNLDALARDALVFERAVRYCPSPTTLVWSSVVGPRLDHFRSLRPTCAVHHGFLVHAVPDILLDVATPRYDSQLRDRTGILANDGRSQRHFSPTAFQRVRLPNYWHGQNISRSQLSLDNRPRQVQLWVVGRKFQLVTGEQPQHKLLATMILTFCPEKPRSRCVITCCVTQESMPYFNFDNWSHYGDSISFGAFDVPDNNMQDGQFADRAVKWIERFSRDQRTKTDKRPFFLGVGFRELPAFPVLFLRVYLLTYLPTYRCNDAPDRPHIPYLAPQKYFDLYPNASEIPLAANPRHAVGMPAVAYSVSQGIRIFKDATAVHANVSRCYNDIQYAYSDACVWVDGPRKVFAQHVKRAYFACISYVDAQIGRIVDALKEHDLYDKTVISFNGDHVRDESSLPC